MVLKCQTLASHSLLKLFLTGIPRRALLSDYLMFVDEYECSHSILKQFVDF